MADTQNPVYTDNVTIAGDGTEEHPLATKGGGGGVTSLNAETGALTLESTGGSVAITTPSGSTINLEVESGILTSTVTLTTAQILALGTVEQILIPAPGAGKAIDVIGGMMNYSAGATPFTIVGGSNLDIGYGSIAQIKTTGLIGLPEIGFLDQVASHVYVNASMLSGLVEGTFGGGGSGASEPLALIENLPVAIISDASSPTLGTGTLAVTLYYKIISVS